MSTNGEFNFHDNIVSNVAGDYASIGLFAFGGYGKFTNNTVSLTNDAIAANHSKGIEFVGNTVNSSGSGIHTDNSNPGADKFDLIETTRLPVAKMVMESSLLLTISRQKCSIIHSINARLGFPPGVDMERSQ